jgi:hypothetical protein
VGEYYIIAGIIKFTLRKKGNANLSRLGAISRVAPEGLFSLSPPEYESVETFSREYEALFPLDIFTYLVIRPLEHKWKD